MKAKIRKLLILNTTSKLSNFYKNQELNRSNFEDKMNN